MRYVDDPSEAFGSWCVRGSQNRRDPYNKTLGYGVRFDREEYEDIDFLYRHFSLADLLSHISAHDKDPRYQRIVQEAYEMKRSPVVRLRVSTHG